MISKIVIRYSFQSFKKVKKDVMNNFVRHVATQKIGTPFSQKDDIPENVSAALFLYIYN